MVDGKGGLDSGVADEVRSVIVDADERRFEDYCRCNSEYADERRFEDYCRCNSECDDEGRLEGYYR